MPYVGYKGDKGAARPPDGSLVETRCLKDRKSAIVPFAEPRSGPKSKTGSGVFFGKNAPPSVEKGLLTLRRCYDTQPQPRELEILL